MARYKVLQSVAHSVGHSFASAMNYIGDDYVLGHLLLRARETGQQTFVLDLMSGRFGPAEFATPPIKSAAQGYSRWLPRLVASHRSDMRWVSAAQLTVTFDLSRERSAFWGGGAKESPFVCHAGITDDRGKVWEATQEGWWFPEHESNDWSGRSTARQLWRQIRLRLGASPPFLELRSSHCSAT